MSYRELIRRRVLRALRDAPLYEGALELIVGRDAYAELRVLERLAAVARATDIGPNTWTITDKGRGLLEALEAERGAA